MSATLTLIPTPLKEELPLSAATLAILQQAAADPHTMILVEELKVARGRWLRWGLPRETIERFVAFNEHTHSALEKQVVQELKAGKSAVLMSDGGLPAFCDPGQGLINLCHLAHIRVTAAPADNSCALALALSGFSHQRFIFQGFLPQKDPERAQAFQELWKSPLTQILMEPPYRRQKLLEELLKSCPDSQKKRPVFIALELNGSNERLLRGELSWLLQECATLAKLEFVLVLGPQP